MNKNVLLVDDQRIIMDGLEIFIDNIQGYEVIGKALSGKEALVKMQELLPDIVLLEYNLPDYDGIDLIPELLKIHSESKVIILTSIAQPQLAIRAIKAGARGFLTKNMDEKGMENVLKGVFEEDKVWLDPSITFEVITAIDSEEHGIPDTSLSEQEKKLLAIVAQGKSNKDIAEELNLKEQTVKNYLFKVGNKLDIHNRSGLAAFAIKNNLI